MELRHLRYFIAVAEEGSFLTAAERRLHTAQPSLSRQIRDLESEVGVKLLERRARSVVLTAAGKVFLDHARLALSQVEAAAEGARRAEQPEKPVFVIGFLAGQEVVWLRTRCASYARKRRALTVPSCIRLKFRFGVTTGKAWIEHKMSASPPAADIGADAVARRFVPQPDMDTPLWFPV